jgi:hypothetical protein
MFTLNETKHNEPDYSLAFPEDEFEIDATDFLD